MRNINLDKDLEYIKKNFKNYKFFKDKNILITGSNGFICFLLVSFFLRYSNDIKFKKLFLADVTKNKFNLKKNVFFKKFNVIKNDFTKFSKKIDIIFHAASIASPSIYRKFPLETIDSNVVGLRKILEYSKKYKVKKILYFSSSEIYGNPGVNEIPTNEDFNGNVPSIGPRACYDEAKRLCETLCYVYNKKFNIPITVVRPFNNYGPGMNINDKRLPADLAKNVLKSNTIKIFSDGKASRSFCYISDAVVGYLKAITHKKKFDVFNIGNDQNMLTVKKFSKIFAEEASRILDKKIYIKYKKNIDKDYLKDNPIRRKPSIKKAKNELNFYPKVDVRNGIRNYINFLRENY